ncbi:enoyl-CoA hydratase-related protein [Streptomyces sp. NPDC003077]|uniref:enoyl-CoA hydratase-related protein n=1 Tax=Streptomyces sp. NPDC003077 TaxID=3154443 RepID=UPI0033A49C6F
MDILLVAGAFDSLSRRVYAELADRGHRLDVVLTPHGDEAVREAVHDVRPELVIALGWETALPEGMWMGRPCLIVRMGPPGGGVRSSLDWAVTTGARHWMVTVLQAEAGTDTGPIWATAPFDVPPAGKSDVYRNEAADAAVRAVLLAVERYAGGSYKPQPQGDGSSIAGEWFAGGAGEPRAQGVDGRFAGDSYESRAQDADERRVGDSYEARPPGDDPAIAAIRPDAFPDEARRIDWQEDTTEVVLRKLRGADSWPGVADTLCGKDLHLHGGHFEGRLRGRPGELLATRAGGICRATRDGAVWIPELRPQRRDGGPATFRLPATLVLGDRLVRRVPEQPAALEVPAHRRTWADIRYRQLGDVGFLHFGFPGGAMSTEQCRRLLAAYRFALTRPTSVLVVGGVRDLFSNGIHLGVIEAAKDPAAESWANVNAMDDLVEAMLRTTDRLLIAALGGNAAAGGVMLALAADEVWCRTGVVLNPRYRRIGLYGSELWTYTLPRRVGAGTAERLMADALPLSAAAGVRRGLVDRLVPVPPQEFPAEVVRLAAEVARDPGLPQRLAAKQAERERDEAAHPLADYRQAELDFMRRAFFDPDAPYHALRSAFVRKVPGSGSPRPVASGHVWGAVAVPWGAGVSSPESGTSSSESGVVPSVSGVSPSESVVVPSVSGASSSGSVVVPSVSGMPPLGPVTSPSALVMPPSALATPSSGPVAESVSDGAEGGGGAEIGDGLPGRGGAGATVTGSGEERG